MICKKKAFIYLCITYKEILHIRQIYRYMCCFSYTVNQIGVLKSAKNINKDPITCIIQGETPISG